VVIDKSENPSHGTSPLIGHVRAILRKASDDETDVSLYAACRPSASRHERAFRIDGLLGAWQGSGPGSSIAPFRRSLWMMPLTGLWPSAVWSVPWCRWPGACPPWSKVG
jgi:hypothetical protein